jgi:hypothetical protein
MDYHCEKCRADYNPYIRPGDVISFWYRGAGLVEGKVTDVIENTYTVKTGGSTFVINHDWQHPVTLIARRGLPVTYEQHAAYMLEHQMAAPNITMEFKMRYRAEQKRRVK